MARELACSRTPAEIHSSQTSNTYNGGTTINGGGLYAANGLTYNSIPANGTLNSATGVGPVVVNSGGTLGGSIAGGAVGMPTITGSSNGPVTINNGGSLAPAGINWLTNSAPVFHVLGNLTLNAGATLDYTFAADLDQVNVGGTLTFPTVSSSNDVTIDVNNLGGLQNGTPIFTLASSTSLANFNPADFNFVNVGSVVASGTEHYSVQQNGTEIDLMAPWLPTVKKSGRHVHCFWQQLGRQHDRELLRRRLGDDVCQQRCGYLRRSRR